MIEAPHGNILAATILPINRLVLNPSHQATVRDNDKLFLLSEARLLPNDVFTKIICFGYGSKV
ncbi:hypothetical protein RRF57_012741 [Xylaria bambusicola]|uniref:Uncharacterized protein n=1 Tax=Xylaria bambusicola TaxID=326684 RepID=A0AAN7UYF8_9PEZI